MNFKDQPMKPEEHQIVFWCSRCNQNVPLEEWMTMNCCIKKQRHYGFLRDEETKLPIHAETIEPNQRELDVYGVPNEETLAAMKEADEIAKNHAARLSSVEELFSSHGKDSYPKAYFLSAINKQEIDETGEICLYSTAEEAIFHSKNGQHVCEIRLKFHYATP